MEHVVKKIIKIENQLIDTVDSTVSGHRQFRVTFA